MTTQFQAWLPTRPYSLTDAINRMAAATGSVRYAMAASGANYNGHAVGVGFNEYRRYWVAEYYWGQRVVLGRGQLADCLRAAKAEYDRGALGAAVVATLRTQDEYDLAISLGYQPYSEEIRAAHDATWKDDRFEEVAYALRAGKTHLLTKATSRADYRRLCDEEMALHRAERQVRP